MHPHDPLGSGHGHLHHADSFFGAPLVGGFLLLTLLLLVGTALYLWHTGRWNLGRPAITPPEEEAKRILAARFARGEINAEEFMERSAILNWTPGVTPAQQPPRLRRTRRRSSSGSL